MIFLVEDLPLLSFRLNKDWTHWGICIVSWLLVCKFLCFQTILEIQLYGFVIFFDPNWIDSYLFREVDTDTTNQWPVSYCLGRLSGRSGSARPSPVVRWAMRLVNWLVTGWQVDNDISICGGRARLQVETPVPSVYLINVNYIIKNKLYSVCSNGRAGQGKPSRR